jgi:beta-mannosidase
VKDEDIVKVVEAMADANFNMVRVWGGGYYPDEVFFETCDELGLMVWQDLMFACAMYPGDDDFISNVTKEFEYQVPRIAGHPSVVQFNGNNEVEVAWGNWGFQIKYGLYGKSAKEIEASYDRLFKDVAPNTIVKYTNIPYIHTSPLSNWGKMELYNHGSQHYWGVWHGRDPIEDFGKKIGRFNAEYGFQSFPEYSTIKTFADSSQWDLSSDVMKHHQKSYVGNDMILKHAKKLYGNPKDFEEFVYYSQLTQAMAVSMAVAGHRLDFPRCGGTLYWQVNDCWQAPTWSSIDYFGNWKALHYRIKDDYEPLTVLQKFNDLKDIEYYVASDLPDTVKLQLIVQIHTLKGKHVETRKETIIFNGVGKQKIDIPELINVSKCKKKKNYVIDFIVLPESGGDKPIISRRFTHIQSDYKKAGEEDVTYSVNYEGGEGMPGTAMIYIESKKFLQDVWVFSDVPGLKFDKNFIHVLPGERAYITVEYENPVQLNGIQLIWR